MTVKTKHELRLRRRRRVRAKVSGTAERPRISMFRSNRGVVAAQLIDDVSGRMRAASFPARVDPQKCLSCPVRSSCPAIGPKMLEET